METIELTTHPPLNTNQVGKPCKATCNTNGKFLYRSRNRVFRYKLRKRNLRDERNKAITKLAFKLDELLRDFDREERARQMPDVIRTVLRFEKHQWEYSIDDEDELEEFTSEILEAVRRKKNFEHNMYDVQEFCSPERILTNEDINEFLKENFGKSSMNMLIVNFINKFKMDPTIMYPLSYVKKFFTDRLGTLIPDIPILIEVAMSNPEEIWYLNFLEEKIIVFHKLMYTLDFYFYGIDTRYVFTISEDDIYEQIAHLSRDWKVATMTEEYFKMHIYSNPWEELYEYEPQLPPPEIDEEITLEKFSEDLLPETIQQQEDFRFFRKNL